MVMRKLIVAAMLVLGWMVEAAHAHCAWVKWDHQAFFEHDKLVKSGKWQRIVLKWLDNKLLLVMV